MASLESNQLRDALLKWVQQFCPQVKTLAELWDGHALFAILSDIDQEYFAKCSLPASSTTETAGNWIPRWQNLKHIQKIVGAYVRDVCGVLDTLAEDAARVPDADLKALATQDVASSPGQSSSAHDPAVLGLIKGILRAAMFSPVSNERMGRIVLGLGPEAAKTIAAALTAMENGDDLDDDNTYAEPPDNALTARDYDNQISEGVSSDPFGAHEMDLEQEERLIKAHRMIRQLEATNAQITIELDGLRKDKTELQEALESFKYQVENNQPSAIDVQTLKELKTKASTDREYIADLENDLAQTKTSLQTHERQLERLRTDNDTKQHLKDEIQLLKADRDEMSQKARAVDNLKKKIQLLQDQDRQSATLREDLRAAQEQLQDYDALRERCERLQKANSENLNIISNTEQEIFDQKTSKKRLEHDLKVSAQKFEAIKERQIRDHDTIADLEQRLQQFEQVRQVSSPTLESNGGLESELQAAERNNARFATSRQPSRDMTTEIEAKVEERLRSVNARNKRLEEEYLGMLQDKLGLEIAVQELRGADPTPPETYSPFLEQRKRLELAQHEIHNLKDELYSLTAALASAKEKLISASTPPVGLSRRGSKFDEASDTDSIATHESLLDVKAEYQALTKSYNDLTRHSEDVESQLAQHQSLVRHALLSHKALLNEPEENRKADEYKLVLEQLSLVAGGDRQSELIDLATSLTDKIEAARSTAAEYSKTVQARDETIASLQKDLAEAATQRKTSGPESARLEVLERELRLVKSNWFDLQTRLQTADVTISKRRAESPKSWLMKRRAEVGLHAGLGVVRR